MIFFIRLNLIETEDAAFNELFYGIVCFLYEGYDYENKREDRYTKKTPEYIKDGIIRLANSLWELGINPGEFQFSIKNFDSKLFIESEKIKMN